MKQKRRNLIKKFGVHIKVSNIETSYKFYKALGFNECFAYGDKDFLTKLDRKTPTAQEKYQGVVFELGESLFEIADGHLAVKPEIFKQKIETSKISAMLHLDSLTTIIAACKKNNIPIAVPPRKFPWGTRELVIKDPDGFVLVFIERV